MEKIIGIRKFLLGVLSLIVYGAIMWKHGVNIDAFNLGIGIGALLTPVNFANAVEHIKGKFSK